MIKKARKIETIYEESLFCDTCDVELEMEKSNIALLQGRTVMPTLVCPKCGKRETLTPDMIPRQLTKAGDWFNIEDEPELKAIEDDMKNELEEAKMQIEAMKPQSSIILD